MDLCQHYRKMLSAECIHPAEECIFHADVHEIGRCPALFYAYIEHIKNNYTCQKEIEIKEETINFWWELLLKELQKESED